MSNSNNATRFYRQIIFNNNQEKELIIILQNPATENDDPVYENDKSDYTTNIIKKNFKNYNQIHILNIIAFVGKTIKEINITEIDKNECDRIHNNNLEKIKDIIHNTTNSDILLACGQDFTQDNSYKIIKPYFIDVINIIRKYPVYYLKESKKSINIDQYTKIQLPWHILALVRKGLLDISFKKYNNLTNSEHVVQNK